MTANQLELIERCKTVIDFLATEPTDDQCRAFMAEQDIDIVSSNPPRLQLFRYAKAHLSVLAGMYVL